MIIPNPQGNRGNYFEDQNVSNNRDYLFAGHTRLWGKRAAWNLIQRIPRLLGGQDMKKSMKAAILVGLLAVIIAGIMIIRQDETTAAFANAKAAEAENAELERERQRTGLLAEADQLFRGYYYDEAIDLLKSDPSVITTATNDAITVKISEIERAKASLVKYDGPVQHIFFHSLIVYPELAFDDKGHPAKGYNMWMATVSEFKKILPRLEEKGYVLYPLTDYIEPDPDKPGNIRLKDIYLPPGKTPLVISVDDVNYYDYMKPDGFADRLVMGEDGRVWTEVITPEGKTVLTRDGDVMPILDDYVDVHPGFSWRGAKGTIALTGYQGALGYRITDGLPREAEWQQTVRTIADTMKADGWSFACHSYTHNGYFRDGSLTMKQLEYDTERWIQKIMPYVGNTNIYISPFGVHFRKDDPRYRYLVEQGFNIYCPVSNERRITFNSDNIVMPRVNIDGYSMTKRTEELQKYYFDVSEVMDPKRPVL